MVNEVVMMAVKQLYPYPGWRRKVEAMPDHQVYGIYYDRIVRARAYYREKEKRKVMKLLKLSQQSKVNDIWGHDDGDKATDYICMMCGGTFSRDNPDLTECELCGSSEIEKLEDLKNGN